MDSKDKKWIDNASYTQLLRLWRHGGIGHRMFQGDIGDYYSKKMREKKEEVGQAAHVAASKSIGWDG